MTDYIASGSQDDPAVVVPHSGVQLAETTPASEDLAHRYCTECGGDSRTRGPRTCASTVGVRQQPRVAGLHNKVRVHIHVNDRGVFRVAARFGTVSGEKADDMQRSSTARTPRRKVASSPIPPPTFPTTSSTG